MVEVVSERYMEEVKRFFFKQIKKYNTGGPVEKHGRYILYDENHVVHISFHGGWEFALHPLEKP